MEPRFQIGSASRHPIDSPTLQEQDQIFVVGSQATPSGCGRTEGKQSRGVSQDCYVLELLGSLHLIAFL
ncbi:hypothetical protein LINGRAHAP2_LOCUS18789 [Linum grandiflorum]